MQKYTADRVRNIALLGHSGSGKSSFIEAVLFNCGNIDRMGKSNEGNLVMDFDAEEMRRHITINTSVASCEWRNAVLSFIDTPGDFDFMGEVQQALRVAGSALILVSAKSGIEVGVEKSVRYLQRPGIPYGFLVNGMDDENADFSRCILDLKNQYGRNIVPFMLPIRENRKFVGFVNVLTKTAYHFAKNGDLTTCDVPADLVDMLEQYHGELVEQAAESSDEFMEKFFNGDEFTEEEFKAGLQERILHRHLLPVLVCSSTLNLAVKSVLDLLLDYFPNATHKVVQALTPDGTNVELTSDPNGPLAALVFKTIADPFVGKISLFRVYSGKLKNGSTVYNANREKEERIANLSFIVGKKQYETQEVSAGDIGALTKLTETQTGDTLSDKSQPLSLPSIVLPVPCLSMAIFPEKQGEEEKIAQGLAKLREEDPTFTYHTNKETKQMIISGLGEMQLDVLVSKLKNKYKVSARLEEPEVPYRETIRKKVKAQGRHKKQSGGHGQFGDVWIEFEPNPEQEELVFEEKVFGGAVPKNYFPAVEKGLREACQSGILAGYPVVNLKATLVDGSYHEVDSSEMAFKIAASLAYKAGLEKASPVLMEPISQVEVHVPENNMGDVMGDINKRRGRIVGIEHKGEFSVISCEVPTSEMARYATDLRSMTQGRGWYTIDFLRYEQMPKEYADKVISKRQTKDAE
ncbi:elongation factor G [Amygdalobacter nucleatus]|uniref:elongation factor G n=1 Tax=Amygdalobacter nucleatus TaxID=3029274 RepID=UPI00279CEAAD|nr:elongation factor G [Amygdalobacter nucleatus]WEG36919.1 elongation factor G [Amygdalobacter nucleatus]